IARQLGGQIRLVFNSNPEAGHSDAILRKVGTYMNWAINQFTVNDFGYMRQIKEAFPEAFLCASAVAHIINAEDARFLQDIGVEQVVSDCKWDWDELQALKDTGISMEVLIHASTCYTFIGSCWWSSYMEMDKTFDIENNVKFLGSPNRGGLCWRPCLEPWNFDLGGRPIARTRMDHKAFFLIEENPGPGVLPGFDGRDRVLLPGPAGRLPQQGGNRLCLVAGAAGRHRTPPGSAAGPGYRQAVLGKRPPRHRLIRPGRPAGRRGTL